MAQWVLRGKGTGLPDRGLAGRLDISPVLLDILWRRGLRSAAAIDEFLNAHLSGLVNPEKWPQIPEAADFLVACLREGRTLAIWGDYDVDGTTSTALVLDVLEFHGYHPLWHIPDRHREGYGLNEGGIEQLHAKGCSVLLTVDSGISDVGPIARARELGMDVVVSDHHLPPETLPAATFLVNPRMLPPEKVPCPHLAGVGVAFFLMAAVNTRLARLTGRSYKMDQVLDLVALGTLADVMTLSGQNRLLVRGGLAHLEHPGRPGLQALKAVSGLQAHARVTATQVGFKLAPRINAAGRMRHASIALKLLRSRSYEDGRAMARELDELNTCRRETEKIILAEARAQALEQRSRGNDAGLVLYGKQWHPGVIGIVATRIVEEFGVPCLIVCDDKDTLKGSGRSVPGFDLYAGLSEIPGHLLSFGGHKQAAGVRILPGLLEAFRQDFQVMTRRHAGDVKPEPLYLDGVLPLADACDPTLLSEFACMEPFGPGNPELHFVSNPVVVESRSTFRSRPDSVDLTLRDTKDGCCLRAKGWGMAESLPPSLLGHTIRVVFTVHQENRYGFLSPEMTIKDWAPVEGTPS